MPTVSVFLLATNAGEAANGVASLRAQTFDDWEGVVIASSGVDLGAAGAASRVRLVHADVSWQDALNGEIEAARSDFVLIVPAGSTLRPKALHELVAEARTSRADAVYAGFRFTAPVGELPGDPVAGLPAILDSGQWEQTKVAPLAAQLLRRDAARSERFDPGAGDAADWDWCLRLSRTRVRWRRCESVVADIGLRPIACAAEILASVRRHATVAAPVLVTTGEGTSDANGGEELFAEAERGIRALIELQETKGAWMRAGMPQPWLVAQWWYRLGFIGAEPGHVLAERPPFPGAPERLVELKDRPTVDIFVASYRRPDRLGAMIESVRATGYPARVLVAAGDVETVGVCERFPEFVECVYSTTANRRAGCTAPLNHVVGSLVRNDALFCTDDCVFAPDSLETAVRSLHSAYPDSDGVVGLAQENIPDGYPLAFPLIGRRFRERFTRGRGGELFYPGYFHMYNDAELGITINCLGRWHFEPRARLRHFHPCTGVAEDGTHARGRTFAQRDAQLWHQRRMEGVVWGVD